MSHNSSRYLSFKYGSKRKIYLYLENHCHGDFSFSFWDLKVLENGMSCVCKSKGGTNYHSSVLIYIRKNGTSGFLVYLTSDFLGRPMTSDSITGKISSGVRPSSVGDTLPD